MKRLKSFLNFLSIVLGYGLIINLMVFGLLDFRFDVFSVLGFGILYYFISEEILIWFRPRSISSGEKLEQTRGEKLEEEKRRNKENEKAGALEKLKKKVSVLQSLK